MEKVINEEYPDLIYNNDIKIKISGCPNSCGQHGLASIGFHGSSIKDKQGNVVPALVVLLGGAKLINGEGVIAQKIIKIPSKRGLDALRFILNDYDANGNEGEYFHSYYQRIGGQKYFYTLLKPLGDMTKVDPDEYIDWGENHNFILHTAVGECAGVIIDLVATLLYESEEKLAMAREAISEKRYADSIYNSYSAFINTAKALLLSNDVRPSTQIQVMRDFQKHYVDTGDFTFDTSFTDFVLRINKDEPTESFANQFLKDSLKFLEDVQVFRSAKKETVSG
jgi:sulfite reductase (ferredoxin)